MSGRIAVSEGSVGMQWHRVARVVWIAGLALAGCVVTQRAPVTTVVAPAAVEVEHGAQGDEPATTSSILALAQAGDWAGGGHAITSPLALLSAWPVKESKPALAAPTKGWVERATALKQEPAAPRSATLTVQNQSSRVVCYLFISPVHKDDWGEDWLGEDESLRPGASRAFTLTAGKYDMQALDCDSQVIAEVRGRTLSGRAAWKITDREPGQQPGQQPAARVAPVTLDQFLCCGHTAGETRIWGISYPRGWRVTLIPDNAEFFVGALFADPASTMSVLIIPSGWTPQNTPMDTGDVDEYLNGLTAMRAKQFPGFREFYRRPLPGVPGRVWAGTWKSRGKQHWESYTVMVTPMPYVEGMPRGGLTLMGLSATSSEWAQASAVYEAMMGTMQIQIIRAGPAYQPPSPGPSDDPVEQSTGEVGKSSTSFWELVFCAKKCDWEWIDVANQPAGQVWECSDGCIGQLSQVPCTVDYCR